jgi:hypothetical protein
MTPHSLVHHECFGKSSDWCKGEEEEARPAKTIHGTESLRDSSAALHLV